MKKICEDIRNLIISTFQENIQVSIIEGGCEVTLPLLDPLNDYIQFYVVPIRNGYRLTDFGQIVEKLRDLNVEIKSSKREAIFESILKTNGIRYSKGILTVDTTEDFHEFQRKLLRYIRAITASYDMEFLQERPIRFDFKSLVWEHLQEKEYNFVPNFYVKTPKIKEIEVDFLMEEKVLLKTLHAPTISYSNSLINKIVVDFEVIGKYKPKYRRAVIYNDESSVSEAPRFGLLEDVSHVPPIPWSEREPKLDEALALA